MARRGPAPDPIPEPTDEELIAEFEAGFESGTEILDIQPGGAFVAGLRAVWRKGLSDATPF